VLLQCCIGDKFTGGFILTNHAQAIKKRSFDFGMVVVIALPMYVSGEINHVLQIPKVACLCLHLHANNFWFTNVF